MEIALVSTIFPSCSPPREIREPLSESAKILFGDIEVLASDNDKGIIIRSLNASLTINPRMCNQIEVYEMEP